MTSSAAAPLIRRDVDAAGICLLTFDRPESGANIFDAGALEALRAQLDHALAQGNIIMSLGEMNTEEDVDYVIDILKEFVE